MKLSLPAARRRVISRAASLASGTIASALLALLSLLMLAACNAPPLGAPEAEASPSALLSAAVMVAQTEAAPASQEAIDAPAAIDGTAQPVLDGGPVPPIAPVAIGDSVVARNPTPVYLPTVTNQSGTVATASDAQAGTVPPVEEGDGFASEGTPPNAALIDTPAGPAFSWQETENFLILGTDRRAEEGSWRTDSIMLVGLDRGNNRAAVFSIPRDLYVNIPGYGWGRINQADYIGERRETNSGPALVGEIVEDILGIPTQHFVRIQMDGFVEFVDALGGVDIYLDCPFSEPIYNLTTQSWTRFYLPAGENHLDGEDAYWFARLRLEGTDIGRSSRQRAIIWAMRDQILSTNALLRLPELYSAFNDTITTDLGLFDIIGLAQTALSLDASNVRASGLTLSDLQDHVTDAGAQVLVIGDPERVRSLVEDVWNAPAMANAFRGKVAGCEVPEPALEPDPVDAPAEEDAPAEDDADAEADGGAETVDSPAAEAAPEGTPQEGESFQPGEIITDPVTGQQFDAVSGLPIDPATGLPYDPAEGN